MIFRNDQNPRIELVPDREYNKDGRYEAPAKTAYAVYNAELRNGTIKPRPGLTLKWTPPGFDGTEEVLASCYASYASNTLYRLNATTKGGSFTISDGSSSTTSIAGDAKPAGVARALASLTNVDSGDVLVYGRQLTVGYQYIEFVGRYAQDRQAPPTLTVATNTAGASLLKLTSGGLRKVVLLIVKKGSSATMYAVDPDTWSHTVLKSGMPVEDYAAVQYGDSIYIASRTYGLVRYRIGGALADGEDPSDSPPRPAHDALDVGSAPHSDVAITPAFGSSNLPSHVTHGTPTWSYPQLDTYFIPGDNLDLTHDRTLELTWSAADMRMHKLWHFTLTTTGTPREQQLIPVMIELKHASGYIQPDAYAINLRKLNGGKYTDGTMYVWFRSDAAGMDAVTGVKFTFKAYKVSAAGWGGTAQRITLTFRDYGALLGHAVDSTILDKMLKEPRENFKGRAIDYAMAYVSPAGVKGPVGAEVTAPAGWRDLGWTKLTMSAFRDDNLAGWKAVALRRHTDGSWRIVKKTDGTTEHTFGVDNNASVYDVYDDTEGASLPVYTSTAVEANSPFLASVDGVLGVWKGCLAIGADRKVWVSAVGDAARYAPSPDDIEGLRAIDPYDESQGVTFYASPNRAEKVLAVVGQDNLYVCTETGVVACAGDLPIDLTPPRRLLGSRPPIGQPCGHHNGVVVPSDDGLIYYAATRGYDGIDPMQQASRNLTEEVPAAWSWLCAAGTPKTFSNGAELYVLAGVAGMWRDPDQKWVRCVFPTAQHAVLFAGDKRYFVAKDGRLAQWDDDARGSDYGQSFQWSVTYHNVVGTRLTMKEAKIVSDSPATILGAADGRAWIAKSVPGVYDMDAHDCPPCVELRLELSGSGTVEAGHVAFQGAYGGSKD